jgi:hypothetical protein
MIHGTKSNGFVNLKGHDAFGEFGIAFAGGIGMYIANADANLSDVQIGDNDSVGIYIRESDVNIYGGSIFNNHVAGIWAVKSSLYIESTQVSSSLKDPGTGGFGDGVAVLLGFADLKGLTIENHSRAGVSNFGATVKVTDNIWKNNVLHFDVEKLPVSALAPGEPAQETEFHYEDGEGTIASRKGEARSSAR